MRSQICRVLVFLSSLVYANSYNILGIFPFTGKSHFLTFQPILKGLAVKGHNVTVLSYFPLQQKLKNYNDIVIDDLKSVMNAIISAPIYDLQTVEASSRKSMYTTFLFLAYMGEVACRKMFESNTVQNVLKGEYKFDIVITEYFNSDCSLAIAKRFNCPIVRVHSASLMPWTDNRYGNPLNPAFVPNNFLPYSDKMTFLERFENTIVTLAQNLYFNILVIQRNNEIVGEFFGEAEKTLGSDIHKDSILLINAHYTLSLPRPYVPNIIEVGGLHVGTNKRLPMNLEKWVNESTYGVIYFSFGSLVKAHTMPDEKRQAFINAFKRLPQRVIWKWENDTLEEKPDNVLIGKWLPQYDILSHPNVKAFISHGGLLGTIEAVHSGVPIMVIPQFGDQHTNAKAVESAGGGVILYMSEATEETIYQSLKKILEPSFQQQAKELSERFRDRPMPPLETAIYWVEYVARHKGAHFMKTAAVGMPFYQYYLLDVIAFIVVVLSIFSYLQYLLLRFVIRKIRGMFGKTVKQKKQ